MKRDEPNPVRPPALIGPLDGEYGMRDFRTITVSTVFLTVILLSRAPASAGVPQTFAVPMRDGVKLSTNVYLPEGDGPWPVALLRSPYPKSGNWSNMTGQMGNMKGYAVVVQDVRGCGQSEGNNWFIFRNDGWAGPCDGYDTVEWIAKQKWCNGKIGTWGVSALGITQNMMAPSRPAHLTCQFVAVGFSNMYDDCAYIGGVWGKSLLETWLSQNKFVEKNQEAFLQHYRYDDFWADLNAVAQAEKVNVPVVYAGGWYDCFSQGTINMFMAVQNRGDKGARGKCKLIMGPWAHGIFKELTYPHADVGRALDAWPWLDYQLKGEKNKMARAPAVQYYVLGDPDDKDGPGCKWRTADDWPPPSTPTEYYLHADKSLRPARPTQANGSFTYEYDPRNPVQTHGGANLVIPVGPMDQRKIESRPDVLVFTGDELTGPLEVTGRITVKLWIASSARDTDFTAKLCDVYPDGRSMLVTDGIRRARFRNSFRKEEFLEPGKIYPIEIDLWSTSLVFSKGHRIRVHVSSSNSPRFEPNPNTGEAHPVGDKMVVAKNTIYVDRDHPSHIVLPAVSLEDAKTKPTSRPTAKASP
jgi:predicted acyl esterase